MTECSQDPTLDIGHGVRVAVRRLDGLAGGAAYWHPCAGGAESYGYVPFNQADDGPAIGGHGWDLLSESPLTLAPSLLCQVCGHHGFIRDGRWVPA